MTKGFVSMVDSMGQPPVVTRQIDQPVSLSLSPFSALSVCLFIDFVIPFTERESLPFGRHWAH